MSYVSVNLQPSLGLLYGKKIKDIEKGFEAQQNLDFLVSLLLAVWFHLSCSFLISV